MSLYHIGLPWTLSTVPIACVYILMARLVKVQIMDFLRSLNLIQNLIVVVLGLAITFLISNNYRLDLAYNHILPIIPLLIGAVAGTIMILCCSNIILRVRYFSRVWIVIGQNTMIVLAFSQCIIQIINNYFVINPVLKYLILALVLLVIAKLKTLLQQWYTCFWAYK